MTRSIFSPSFLVPDNKGNVLYLLLQKTLFLMSGQQFKLGDYNERKSFPTSTHIGKSNLILGQGKETQKTLSLNIFFK